MLSDNNHKNDWLEYLQRESWHLELLISGFSIYLLYQGYSGLSEAFQYLELHVVLNENIRVVFQIFIGILLMGSIILMGNLILHVFIRGFWVGTIGLRSVQEKINIEELGYSKFFTHKLREKAPSLDKLLERLDTLASVIFSFSFLVVFMFLSLFFFVSATILIFYLFELLIDDNLSEGPLKTGLEWIFGVFMVGWFFMGVIYMIDTLSLGFFKKFSWLSKLFYPVYKIMGVVTLAGLYRGIYYSLISRFSKGKILIALSFYILLFVFPIFFKYDQYIYYPDNGSYYKLDDTNYDDVRVKGANIYSATIPSKIVKDSFLPLFIRYQTGQNKVIKEICHDWKPKKKDGLNSSINASSNGPMNNFFIIEENPGKALDCLSEFFTVTIDSSKIETDYYLYRHPNKEERGIMTMIDIDTLKRGKHIIDIKRKGLKRDKTIVDINYVRIPFWKE